MSVVQELSPPGIITGENKWDFDFVSAEKQFESYNGLNVRLRCEELALSSMSFLLGAAIISSLPLFESSLRISRRNASFGSPTMVLLVYLLVKNDTNFIGEPPEINQSIKMEVGIEDCLHIEFEYGRSKYHLKVLY